MILIRLNRVFVVAVFLIQIRIRMAHRIAMTIVLMIQKRLNRVSAVAVFQMWTQMRMAQSIATINALKIPTRPCLVFVGVGLPIPTRMETVRRLYRYLPG